MFGTKVVTFYGGKFKAGFSYPYSFFQSAGIFKGKINIIKVTKNDFSQRGIMSPTTWCLEVFFFSRLTVWRNSGITFFSRDLLYTEETHKCTISLWRRGLQKSPNNEKIEKGKQFHFVCAFLISFFDTWRKRLLVRNKDGDELEQKEKFTVTAAQL